MTAYPTITLLARQEIVALAIHNARNARFGAPTVGSLDRVPWFTRDRAMDEAAAALAALRTAGFEV